VAIRPGPRRPECSRRGGGACRSTTSPPRGWGPGWRSGRCGSVCRPRSHGSDQPLSPPATLHAATAGARRTPRCPRPDTRTRWTRQSRCPWPEPTSQRPPSLAGTPPPDTLGMQQTGQEQHAALGHIQNSGVCDAHQAQNLYEVDLGRTAFIPGFRVLLLYGNRFGVSSTTTHHRYPKSPTVTRKGSVTTHDLIDNRWVTCNSERVLSKDLFQELRQDGVSWLTGCEYEMWNSCAPWPTPCARHCSTT
jgi:hypothetical protein